MTQLTFLLFCFIYSILNFCIYWFEGLTTDERTDAVLYINRLSLGSRGVLVEWTGLARLLCTTVLRTRTRSAWIRSWSWPPTSSTRLTMMATLLCTSQSSLATSASSDTSSPGMSTTVLLTRSSTLLSTGQWSVLSWRRWMCSAMLELRQ